MSLPARHLRRGLATVTACAGLLAPSVCRATENEWHLGVAAGWSVTEATYASAQHGFGGVLSARYGLTDAIDIDFNVSAAGYPDKSRMIFGSTVGLSYVLDVSRWIPWVGATVGFVDDWRTGGCEDAPALCTHTIQPALGVPIGFEYRVTPTVPVGIRFEYQFLFLGEPSSQVFLGIYGGFIP
ncbi:MAG: hypothetical protein U0271_07835 [Polyangiaceae bacterium]